MIGRPRDDEAAPNSFTYVNHVTGDDSIAVIEDQLPEHMNLFSTISEEKSLYRYAPGKWSIREVLNHVTDTERAFAFRALWFARGFSEPARQFRSGSCCCGSRGRSRNLVGARRGVSSCTTGDDFAVQEHAAGRVGAERRRKRLSRHRAGARVPHPRPPGAPFESAEREVSTALIERSRVRLRGIRSALDSS